MSTLRERKLIVNLEKMPTPVTGKSPKGQDDIIPDIQDGVSANGPGPTIVSDVPVPKDARLRVVDGEIVNLPVTVVETSDAPMVVDSSEKGSNYSADSISSRDADIVLRGKKRRRKPKESNVPGAKSLSEMSATSMDDDDEDMLERPDFQRIMKKDTRTGKKRKLQECPLDDSLRIKKLPLRTRSFSLCRLPEE